MHQNHSGTYILRVDKGEKIVEVLLQFCEQNQIFGAWISGLGAISRVKLACYNLDKKKYIAKEFNGKFEIVSLVGNIGKLEKKAVAHLHMVISDAKMDTYGGHLEEATVAATCEIKIETLDVDLTRKHNPEIGLNLIEL